MLDLVRQVPAHHVEQLAAGDVRRAEQLAVVPGAARLVLGLLHGEALHAGREVAAEDDVERPDVPDQVRGRVARQGQREQRPGEQPGTARSP